MSTTQLDTLNRRLANERYSPILLPYHEVPKDLQSYLKDLQEDEKSENNGTVRDAMSLLGHRINYLIEEYHRHRLRKISDHPFLYTREEMLHLLTTSELVYARGLKDLLLQTLQRGYMDRLKAKLPTETVIPIGTEHVNFDPIVILDEKLDETTGSLVESLLHKMVVVTALMNVETTGPGERTLTLKPNETYILPFALIYEHVRMEQVLLRCSA
ncbi:hypothetical protein GMRT_10850 [Giardia muris]|uniref:GINS subunit domain-containing protein n=1 Tax=Giardia muris TaxID=5742 RepID=A0A4Z1SP20_GIAMU|nr:hypothetical protein GMRT_10850 [Giardia muris]|eukprot:TNJ27546.1 hypothetical protein GMRT_10850 [Giardia muris]